MQSTRALHANSLHFAPNFGRLHSMLDRFDIALLNLVQKDDGRTAVPRGLR